MSPHEDSQKPVVRKRALLAAIASAGGLSTTGLPVAATGDESEDTGGGDQPGEGPGQDGRGRGRYPIVDLGQLTGVALSRYAIEVALHPNHDRAAFTSVVFDEGWRLYLAEEVSSPSDPPAQVRRVTDSQDLVAALQWSKDNRLQYDRGFTRYERKIPPSHKEYARTVVAELSFAGVNSL